MRVIQISKRTNSNLELHSTRFGFDRFLNSGMNFMVREGLKYLYKARNEAQLAAEA